MMKLYGIKDPDIENAKTIKKKALKYELDTSNIVTVNSKEFLFVFCGVAKILFVFVLYGLALVFIGMNQ